MKHRVSQHQHNSYILLWMHLQNDDYKKGVNLITLHFEWWDPSIKLCFKVQLWHTAQHFTLLKQLFSFSKLLIFFWTQIVIWFVNIKNGLLTFAKTRLIKVTVIIWCFIHFIFLYRSKYLKSVGLETCAGIQIKWCIVFGCF